MPCVFIQQEFFHQVLSPILFPRGSVSSTDQTGHRKTTFMSPVDFGNLGLQGLDIKTFQMTSQLRVFFPYHHHNSFVRTILIYFSLSGCLIALRSLLIDAYKQRNQNISPNQTETETNDKRYRSSFVTFHNEKMVFCIHRSSVVD